MASVRPVIEIDVQDAAFQRFYSLFEHYTDELDKQPVAWRALSEAMGEGANELATGTITAKEALAVAAAQAAVIAEALEKAMKAQHGFGSETASTAKHMDALHKAAEGVGKAISAIGGWIVKLGAFGGLGALLSGFGIGDLAGAAFARTKAAGQLGISPGALASFSVNMQQFLDQGAIQSAAGQQLTLASLPYFQMLGLDGRRAMSESPIALAQAEYRAAALGYRSAPRGMFYQTREGIAAQALGLDPNQIRNIALHLDAFDDAVRQTNKDVALFAMPDRVQREWTRLQIKLASAGTEIQTALIDALAPLAPQIGELAGDIADFIKTFVNEKDFGIVVDDLKLGLKDIAHFLETVDWKKIGNEIEWLAQKLGWLIPTHPSTPTPFGRQTLWDKLWTYDDWADPLARRIGSFFSHVASGARRLAALSSTSANVIGSVVSAANKYGVDPILALATGLQESGLNPKAVGDQGSSFGLFQLHRTGELGNLTPQQAFDARTNALVALRNFAIERKHHPNLSPGEIAALAQRPLHPGEYARSVDAIYRELASEALNLVISTVDHDIREHGKDWAHYLPADVRAFVNAAHLSRQERSGTDIQAINRTLKAVFKRRPHKPPVHVSVTNTTSSRVAVSVNAAALS